MNDDELIEVWIAERRVEGEDVEDGAFTAAVMKRLEAEPKNEVAVAPRPPISRTVLASLCFGIGFAKLLVALHLTF